MEIPRLFIGVDRQDQVINWSQRADKRNVTISSVAAADNETGYVFGMVPNFEAEPNSADINAELKALGELQMPACHRTHARLWLQQEFDERLKASKKYIGRGTLPSTIAASYATAVARSDVEAPEHVVLEDISEETREYLEALDSLHTPTKTGEFIQSKMGRNGGTFAHPKLAIHFARWLDVGFSVWCDAVIEDLLAKKAELVVTKPETSASLKAAPAVNPAILLSPQQLAQVELLNVW